MKKYTFLKFCFHIFGGRFLNLCKKYNRYVTGYFDGNPITFDLNSEIGSTLFVKGEFEKKEIELCEKYIKKDSVVLDVGANIGIHSIYYSKMAEDGLVFSFEPSPETFTLLLNNVERVGNIVPVNFGISNSKHISDFYMASDIAYSGLKDTKRKEIIKSVKVFCCDLDSLFTDLSLKSIDFVKIDVEGLEQEVLDGMNWIIEKYHPVIFCEIYKGTDSNEDPEKTIHHLEKKGYDVFVFDGNGLKPFEKHSDRFYNYFFLPKNEKI